MNEQLIEAHQAGVATYKQFSDNAWEICNPYLNGSKCHEAYREAMIWAARSI